MIGRALLFFRTKVSATTPPGNTDLVAKAFVSVGGSVVLPTRRVELPGFPGPPLVDDAAALFTLSPVVVAVTVTVIEQNPPIGSVAPVIDTELLPGFATTGTPQVVLAFAGIAICSPAGKMSVTLTPVRGTVLAAGFVIVMVRMLFSPTRIDEGENDLLRIGGATTVRSAIAGSPGSFPVAVMKLEILCFKPAALPVTCTAITQVPGANTAATKETVAAVIVNVPPQTVESPIGLATSPNGRLSVNTTF